jgi:ATP synthase protein I
MANAENNKDDDLLSEQVSGKEKRKLKAQGTSNGSVWSGLGMFGMVGWSVAVPTLLGTALGLWLDKKYPVTFSWTLSCLVTGLFSGCVIAWYWISKNNNDE